MSCLCQVSKQAWNCPHCGQPAPTEEVKAHLEFMETITHLCHYPYRFCCCNMDCFNSPIWLILRSIYHYIRDRFCISDTHISWNWDITLITLLANLCINELNNLDVMLWGLPDARTRVICCAGISKA